MVAPSCKDDEFIALWRQTLSPNKVSETLDINLNAVFKRRRRIEERYDIILPAASSPRILIPENNRRLELTIENGVGIVGSDFHLWPGPFTTAQRAFLHFSKKLKPIFRIRNGDVFDGARISNHQKLGWDQLPTVKQELDAVEEFEKELRRAHKAQFEIWTKGNHDLRFEQRLAIHVPEYEAVSGMTLKDRFPEMQHCMSVMVNENTMIKHRYHNGIHAAYNNALKSGTSIVTGHLHSLKVTPWTDYTGTRYGVDTGTLAAINGEQFQYMEDNPRNWRAGFAVLTFSGGTLMAPELCEVIDEEAGTVFFRGQVVTV